MACWANTPAAPTPVISPGSTVFSTPPTVTITDALAWRDHLLHHQRLDSNQQLADLSKSVRGLRQ